MSVTKGKPALAILGASQFQVPLILQAKNRGLDTHVFAWKCGDIGESIADFYYPISITEKEQILNKCQDIGIEGICSIASDLASVSVSYVAENMGLTGNSVESALKSTNKHLMRQAFEQHKLPSPRSIMVSDISELDINSLSFPVVIKPLDRSGSRGITFVESPRDLNAAISLALSVGFEKKVLVEEYAIGDEYSIECISYKGRHSMLAITQKYTTGIPHFIENGHIEPPFLLNQSPEEIKSVVFSALDSLDIKYGASHSELKITPSGKINLIEVGARMGGDYIGSHLVKLSTGYDYVNAVIDIALGIEPSKAPNGYINNSAVRFIFDKDDVDSYGILEKDSNCNIELADIPLSLQGKITDSSNRLGSFVFKAPPGYDIKNYMPKYYADYN